MRNIQHTLSWILLIVCGFFLALTTVGAPANSNNCGQPSPKQAAAMADVVVQGKVLNIEFCKPSEQATRTYAIITLAITYGIKGATQKEVMLITSSPEQYGWFPFQKGGEYIVFANQLHNGQLYTSRYMGNMIANNEAKALEQRQRIFEPERFQHSIDIGVYQLQPVNHKLGVGIKRTSKAGKSS